jgi:hypothetical protein
MHLHFVNLWGWGVWKAISIPKYLSYETTFYTGLIITKSKEQLQHTEDTWEEAASYDWNFSEFSLSDTAVSTMLVNVDIAC